MSHAHKPQTTKPKSWATKISSETRKPTNKQNRAHPRRSLKKLSRKLAAKTMHMYYNTRGDLQRAAASHCAARIKATRAPLRDACDARIPKTTSRGADEWEDIALLHSRNIKLGSRACGPRRESVTSKLAAHCWQVLGVPRASLRRL